jgi:hypothetical protein
MPKTSPKNTPTITPKPTDESIPTTSALSTPLPTNSPSLLLGEQTYYGIIITIVTILVVLALTGIGTKLFWVNSNRIEIVEESV